MATSTIQHVINDLKKNTGVQPIQLIRDPIQSARYRVIFTDLDLIYTFSEGHADDNVVICPP